MDIKVQLTRNNQAPRKVRLVADLIRGKSVDNAISQLIFLPKRASTTFTKLINSAVANAKHNFGLNQADLFVKEVRVDGGIVMKRSMPRAFGRSSPIKKRTSNITLILSENGKKVAKQKSSKIAPKKK
jgi:large subunit ribosomal protein L22